MVRASIESVLNQEFKDFELVLVDDASTDSSADVLREYADRATVVVREQNGGEMASRNSALGVSRGQYVCFLDSDDQWFSWTLANYRRAIEEHGGPAFVIGEMFEFTDDTQVGQVSPGEYVDSVTRCYSTGAYYMGVVAAAIRRADIEEVGRFNDVRFNGMDIDLMFRLGDRPGLVKIKSPVMFAYRIHGGNIMGNFDLRYRGAMHWIAAERAGKYPGGAALRADRLRHITMHVRAISVHGLHAGRIRTAWDLYRQSFRWNVELRRWTYLLTFPLMAICPPLVRARETYFKRKRRRATIAGRD